MNQTKNPLSRTPIGDGIAFNFLENTKYKTNYLSLYLVSELNERNASYNALLSRVLTRGSEKYPTQQKLNAALDHCYDAQLDADVLRVGEWHALDLSLTTLDNAFAMQGEDITEKGCEILSEMLFSPLMENGAFKEEFVESEKKNALDDIRAEINSKARYSRKRMIRTMCRGEKYATDPIGSARVIRSITKESLTEYYRSLLEKSRIEIFFVGRGDGEKLAKTWKKLFSAIRRNPAPLEAAKIRRKAGKVKEVTEEMDITQANLVMGFRTGTVLGEADWRAMSVYNSVLGGSLTSKLFCVLREKMSLCYTISSSPDALKGIMLIYSGIAPEKRDITVKEALHQMKLIEEGEIGEEEMTSAKNALIHSLRGLNDNPAVLGNWYLPRILSGNTDTPEKIIEELKEVTVEDVVRVSKKITLDTVYCLTGKGESENA